MLKETEYYDVISINDEHHWNQERTKGIGGSDAGIICGLSKYKTPYELWEEKTGLKVPKFQTSKAIDLGNRLEPVLFSMFKESFSDEYEIIDTKNISLVSKKYPFMRANLDGALVMRDRDELGVLEIKTTTIMNKSMLELWQNQVPQTYYCQILHYLIVTGFKYAILYAWIRFPFWDKAELRKYEFHVEDEQIQEDMEFLIEKESEFWMKVKLKTPPKFIELKID